MNIVRTALTGTALFLAPASALGCEVEFRPDGKNIKERAALVFARAGTDHLDNLIACFADPDPAIRDDGAFALWAEGLRNKHLSPASMRHASLRLSAVLASPDDDAGFHKPFAALALSEIARADRIEPYLTESELHGLAETGATYLRGVTDYRGFVAGEGWRHGVAHGADLALQLALNPRLSRTGAELLLDAIAAQVAPATSPYYHQGEAARLARPVLFLARRADIGDDAWAAWFNTLHPDTGDRWQKAYASDAGLAAVHNSTAFASAVYVASAESADPQIHRLARLARALLRALP